MPVAVEMNFSGATTDQYDQILNRMGLTPGGSTPPGAISHWVAKTEDGLRVVDVWESQEAFDSYAQEKIMPYSRDAGIEGMPETTFYEVHSYLTK
jgi:hypothetical protein